MKVKCFPSLCEGQVNIPPSKSMAHRAIICASLAKGTSTLTNVSYSKDIIATIEAMKCIGATIVQKEDILIITGTSQITSSQKEIFCNESGSTLRFLIPIFSLCNQELTFTGAGRLMERPQTIYQDLFQDKKLTFIQNKQGITIDTSLPAGEYLVKGDISSQFISGLLFTLPLLKGDSILKIIPPYESKSYVDLTLQMLHHYHIQVDVLDDNTYFIKGNQQYIASDYAIEGDYSQLAFFAVYAAIHGQCYIQGMNHHSYQGDKQIIDILKKAGASIQETNGGYIITKNKLQGTTIDLANCPDLGPILCVLGMYSEGTTIIENAGRLRIKESDRIAAMETELRKFGCDISSDENTITIHGKSHYECHAFLNGHNDHRIVMALAIASACSTSTTIIDGAQAISKSYPNFFEDYQKANGKVEYL